MTKTPIGLGVPALKDHPGSLYLQIAAMLRRRISIGDWQPGDQLPTLAELGREFDVARVTVRQALGLLEKEGLVWSRQGKGTFVSDKAGDGQWISLQTAWAEMVRLVGMTAFSQIEASARIPRIQSDEGRLAAAYRFFRRVYTRENQPYALLNLYLEENLFARSPSAFSCQPAITVLDALPDSGGVVRAHQRLTINTADLDVAGLVNVPLNSPVAEVRRVMKNSEGVILYLAEIIYRGDFVRLDINLK